MNTNTEGGSIAQRVLELRFRGLRAPKLSHFEQLNALAAFAEDHLWKIKVRNSGKTVFYRSDSTRFFQGKQGQSFSGRISESAASIRAFKSLDHSTIRSLEAFFGANRLIIIDSV